jgi:hypothetical protein
MKEHPMIIVDTAQSTQPVRPVGSGGWRTWNLVVLGGLSAYSAAIGWQAQLVSYPLFREVPAGAFAAYHDAYSQAIPVVVIVPGFLTFIVGAAFYWTKPKRLSRALGTVVSTASAVALGATVLWAIPEHSDLDRNGASDATVDSLLTANLIRSLALTVSAVALGWGIRRLLTDASIEAK